MPKRAPTSADAASRSAVTRPDPSAPPAAPRISGITYALGPDHTLTTTATYRYASGMIRPASLRLDAHRYDLMSSMLGPQRPAGAAEVAAALHDLYYCLYAPRPRPVSTAQETGSVPDRP